jgi:hypothetical protein
MHDERPTRFWPARWAKQETFWEGVAIQTVGTILAALLIAIFLSVVGLGDYSAALRFYTSAAIVGLFAIGSLIAVAVLFSRLASRRPIYLPQFILWFIGFIGAMWLYWMFFQFVILGKFLPALQDWYGFPP